MRVYHCREIAKNMKISRQTVCNWCKKLGLELPLSVEELEKLQNYYTNEKLKIK